MKEQAKVNVPENGILGITLGGVALELELGRAGVQGTPVTIRSAKKVQGLRLMQGLPMNDATPPTALAIDPTKRDRKAV
jgi:hypothetical protein